ncbi:MAG TPA: MarR family transcriptional regulator [Candidatus Aminicenantes bacterium]|nr:MarR family transcriptional regulator [Candidatus Aminicenantes bacterium]
MSDNSRERFPESVAIHGRRRETARQEFTARARVLQLLAERGPLTVPETARELGIGEAEANWWLMGYVRYGRVKASEKPDEDGFYRYALAEAR